MKKYIAEDAKAIIRSYGENWIEFRDDGVHYSPDIFTYDLGQELIWKYVLELDGDDAPNPLTAPCLPFPFTAHELAAFMLDGIGAASIPANYAGSWESGPDSGMLESIGDLGRDAKRALCEAYAAIHAAEKAIGSSYPLELLKELDRLGDECTNAPLDKDLQKEHSLVEKRYQVAFATWRKAMVNWLLRPEASESIPKPTPAPVQTAGTPGVVDVAPEPLATPQPELQTATPAPAPEEPITPAKAVPEQTDQTPALNTDMLATPNELIAAFGVRTGMCADWFKSLRDKPGLMACRRQIGKGGNNPIPPLFDVYAVMNWLMSLKPNTGTKINEEQAWRLLKTHFPKVYVAYEIGDPNED